MIDKNSIHVSDKVHMNHTNIFIHSIISDLNTYALWWPNTKITKLDDSRVEVSPAGPGSFTWEIIENEKDSKVVLQYKGIFSGTGTWRIDKDGAMSYLTYHVSATIDHGFYRFINKFVSLNKLHSKMMKNVFKSLDTYLNNYHHETN